MYRFSAIVSVVLAALVLALVHVAGLYYDDSSNPASRRVEIRVLPGATLNEVQTRLVETGVLKRPGLFRWAAYLTRKERKIQAGRYIFMRGENVAAALYLTC